MAEVEVILVRLGVIEHGLHLPAVPFAVAEYPPDDCILAGERPEDGFLAVTPEELMFAAAQDAPPE